MKVYDNYGHELCITATNVSTMTVEYFHPKTTPDMAVALAVKCSAALPGKNVKTMMMRRRRKRRRTMMWKMMMMVMMKRRRRRRKGRNEDHHCHHHLRF